jgi:hypothetical protein
MVVEIDIGCFASFAVPPEDQPPLLVHPDGMQPREVAMQLLEMVAGRCPQVGISRRIVDHLELSEYPSFEIGRDVTRLAVINEELAQPSIAKSYDHQSPP